MNIQLEEGKVLLLDGMNLINRGYYANMGLTSKDGVPSGAIFGFVKYLQLLEEEFKPSGIIVAMDRSRKTFRREMFPDYKAQRGVTDDALKSQFSLVKEYLKLSNIHWLDSDVFEADDILGTLSREFSGTKLSPYIVSGDRDLHQTVNAHVKHVFVGNKGLDIFDEAKVIERYEGLTPSQLVDFKGLSGDASDNIPGVKGVGEKTAIKLLQEYTNIEGVYENIELMKGKRKENLINDEKLAYMCRDLATIRCDVELDLDDICSKLNNYTGISTQESRDYLKTLDIVSLFK